MLCFEHRNLEIVATFALQSRVKCFIHFVLVVLKPFFDLVKIERMQLKLNVR